MINVVSKNEIEIRCPVIEIQQSNKGHIKMLTDCIREADREEILALGFSPHRALMKSYKASLLPNTAFIDGKIAAMWGCVGGPFSDTGMPWLITTDEVYKISPLRFTRIYQKQVKDMLKIFPYLENYVDTNYEGAKRLLDIVGFTLEPAAPYLNGAMFHKFWKKAK